MKITRLLKVALALTPLSLGLLTFTTLSPALSAPAAASDGLPPGAPPLTAAQKLRQQNLLQQFETRANALRANNGLSAAQKQQQFSAMTQELQKQMRAILTPAQLKVVDAQNAKVIALQKQFLQEHAAEIKQQQAIGKKLQASMTPAQRQKINSIQQQAQAQMEKLEANTKETPVVKERTAQAIMSNATQQGLAILTPTQQLELKQFRASKNRMAQELAAFAKAHGQQ